MGPSPPSYFFAFLHARCEKCESTDIARISVLNSDLNKNFTSELFYLRGI